MTLFSTTDSSLADEQAPKGIDVVDPSWTTRNGLLSIHSANVGGHWKLALHGDLDLSNAATLEKEICRAEASAETVTIDLAGLTFMDSSGLKAILEANERSRLTGRLRIRKGTRRVQAVFRLTGTEDSVPFAS